MSRIRSPRYPNHNLEETIALVSKIHEQDRQHPVSRDVAARHMGFSGVTGTSDRALASLIHYGLAEKATKGELKVSALALAILHPTHENERMIALNVAGFNPELFRELRSRYPESPPSAAGLESYLTRQGFAPAAIRPASNAYLETCQFLQRNGAYESVGGSALEGSDSVDNIEPKEEKKVNPVSIGEPIALATPSPYSIRGDVFTLQGGGEVIANLPDSMSSRDYEDLKDWLELMIRKAGRKVLSMPPATASKPEPEGETDES